MLTRYDLLLRFKIELTGEGPMNQNTRVCPSREQIFVVASLKHGSFEVYPVSRYRSEAKTF